MEGNIVETQLITDVAQYGLGWMAAAYLFTLLLREKDKRIQDAHATKAQDTKLLKDIRKLFNTLARKANNVK